MLPLIVSFFSRTVSEEQWLMLRFLSWVTLSLVPFLVSSQYRSVVWCWCREVRAKSGWFFSRYVSWPSWVLASSPLTPDHIGVFSWSLFWLFHSWLRWVLPAHRSKIYLSMSSILTVFSSMSCRLLLLCILLLTYFSQLFLKSLYLFPYFLFFWSVFSSHIWTYCIIPYMGFAVWLFWT